MSRRYLAALALAALALLFSRPEGAWASAPNMRANPATVKPSPSARPSPVGPRFKLAPRAPEATTRHVVEPTFPYKGSTAHALALAAAGQTLPMWQHSEDYPGGNSYTYTMVGASPFIAGAGSTTITAPIIPIKFVRQTAGTTLSDASQVASDCSQTLSPVGLTQVSPMFQNQVPDPEGNGTQWVDALQRGNFDQQTQTGGISPSYHVLLSATTPGGITVTVPDADTTNSPGTTCGTSSGVDEMWFFKNFSGIVANLVTSGFISTTQFPLFVMYNTVLCDVNNCTSGALGFHDVAQTASGLQIFGVYDYDLSGNWSSDTATMSHELAEAIDDPLTNNPVPTWGYIGQDQSKCQQNLEPGDPLSAGYPGSPNLATDTYTIGGITYVFSLQDMAYHSWFYREPSPPTSKAVANVYGTGGQYSLLGFFTGSSSTTVCPGQPTGVTATAGNGQAVVSWTSGPGPVDSYIVIPYLGSTPQNPLVYSSTATSQTVMGLTNGSSYTFTVLAAHANTNASFCPYNQQRIPAAKAGVDCSTESLPSNAVTPNVGVLPGPPTGVVAIGGDASAAVSWTAPADGGSPITKYTVTPYIGSTAQPSTDVTGAPPATSATISNLSNGTSYTFKVTATNAVGTGPPSAASNAVTPLAPYVVGVVGTDNGLWTHANGGTGFTSGGGVLTGAPAVVAVPQTSGLALPIYLGTGTDHDVYVRNDTRGWQRLTTSTFSCIDNPAGVVIGSTLYVACQGSNHALWHAETAAPTGTNLPSVAFSAWQSLGGVVIAGPSVAAVAGTPTYVVVGTGNQVYQRTLITGYSALSSWRCTGHPALASSGSTTYFACHGLDGALYYATNTGSGWSAAQSLGGGLIDGPGIAAAASGPIFFAEGTDHALYHRSITGPWIRDGGGLQFGAAAAAL